MSSANWGSVASLDLDDPGSPGLIDELDPIAPKLAHRSRLRRRRGGLVAPETLHPVGHVADIVPAVRIVEEILQGILRQGLDHRGGQYPTLENGQLNRQRSVGGELLEQRLTPGLVLD